MPASRLVNRNVTAQRGRTSMRLEPELWDALGEICQREHISIGDLVQRIEATDHPGGRTSAVRVYVLQYFRIAASEQGHQAVGHGTVEPRRIAPARLAMPSGAAPLLAPRAAALPWNADQTILEASASD